MEQRTHSLVTFQDVDFRGLRLRFLDINRARLELVQSTIRPHKQRFLNLLPLLFHVNHPMFPGYVSSRCPSGISYYRPDKAVQEEAQSLAKGYKPNRGALREDIHALYLMGSAGSIAFADKSDLDIWICHDPRLSEEEQQLLLQKARILEKWGAEMNLEVHFFLINAETFRTGNIEDLSDESSGSAQHILLLEEFYRSSILLAGRYPVWWLVPPKLEAQYDEAVAYLLEKRFIQESEVLDFGGLGSLPGEEFFGAAVWQLSKGINSPYKSALKILLAECYAHEYPQVLLLGMQFKQAVHDGVDAIHLLDPYLMLLKRLETYLTGQEPERLQLARVAFYLKIQAPLSRKPPESELWRYQTLDRLVSQWGWDQNQVRHLDNRRDWKVDVVEQERKNVIRELTRSYQMVSDFARRLGADARISKQDLNILGRKLFAAFERKAGKVDMVNRGIAKDLSEVYLTIHQVRHSDNRSHWLLFRGHVSLEDSYLQTPLKRGRTLIEILTWCYFNDVLTLATNLTVFRNGLAYPQEEAITIYKSLEKHFPKEAIQEPAFEAIAQPACLVASVVFVNHTVPMSELPSSKAVPRGNSNFDAFSYSGLNINLVLRIDWVFTTSWGEVYCFSYFGQQGVIDFLTEYLERLKQHASVPVPVCTVYAFIPEYASVICGRVEQLWRDLAALYPQEKPRLQTRYLMALEKQYLLLQYLNDRPQVQVFDSQPASVLRVLAAPNPHYSTIQVDSYCMTNLVLPEIYRFNRPGKIQLFYMEKADNKIDIYLLDENGSLYFQSSGIYNAAIVLSHYIEFLQAVITRLNMHAAVFNNEIVLEESLEMFQIKREKDGRYHAGRRILRELRPHQDVHITAICYSLDESDRSYSIYCGNQEFSTLEHGAELFTAVAREVVRLRPDHNTQPTHIADIDLANSMADQENQGGRLQTIHYLNHKRYLETQLNKALAELTEPTP